MPPRRSTVREYVSYEYAKMMTEAAKGPRPKKESGQEVAADWWRFVALMYKKLLRGEVNPSGISKENKMLVREENRCAYCGCADGLQWEHIIPKSRGGPDTIDNLVLACRACNLQKGAKHPIEWFKPRRLAIPRMVLGKLLKLILDQNERLGTLDSPIPLDHGGKPDWIAAFQSPTNDDRA
jgi:hypothetical protein